MAVEHVFGKDGFGALNEPNAAIIMGDDIATYIGLAPGGEHHCELLAEHDGVADQRKAAFAETHPAAVILDQILGNFYAAGAGQIMPMRALPVIAFWAIASVGFAWATSTAIPSLPLWATVLRNTR